jgi:hypothetical protein
LGGDDDKRAIGERVQATKQLGEETHETIFTPELPHLAICVDTTVEALIPDSSDTADQILPCPVIIVECTPLEASKNDEAAKRGHICWNQLQLFVLEEKRKAANEE